MSKIAPVEYINIVKYQITLLSYLDTNQIIFDYVDTPIKLYSGKQISFVHSSNTYIVTYYKMTINGQETNVLTITNNDDSSLPVIASNTVLDIYGTFSIEKNNELPTIQDIVDVFSHEDQPTLTSVLGSIDSIVDVKPGLVSSIDRLKLTSTKFLVNELDGKKARTSYGKMFSVNLSSSVKSYTIRFVSGLALLEFDINVVYINGDQTIWCYFKHIDDSLKLKFETNTGQDVEGNDVVNLTIYFAKKVESLAVTYYLSYETSKIENHFDRPITANLASTLIPVDAEGTTDLFLETNIVSFINGTTIKNEIDWLKSEW